MLLCALAGSIRALLMFSAELNLATVQLGLRMKLVLE